MQNSYWRLRFVGEWAPWAWILHWSIWLRAKLKFLFAHKSANLADCWNSWKFAKRQSWEKFVSNICPLRNIWAQASSGDLSKANQTAFSADCRMVDMRSESGFTPLHFAVSASKGEAGTLLCHGQQYTCLMPSKFFGWSNANFPSLLPTHVLLSVAMQCKNRLTAMHQISWVRAVFKIQISLPCLSWVACKI